MTRLVPHLPLPPYAFVPGRNVHPNHPGGHSHGIEHPAPAPLFAERWQECVPYLFGIDLFNHGYYWEAHEAWEGLWQACGREGEVGRFLQGLIKLAAAGVKQREGKPDGVRWHAQRAGELWQNLPETFLGFKVSELIELAGQIARDGWPGPPVLTVQLEPSQPGRVD